MGVMVKNKVARFFMDHGVYWAEKVETPVQRSLALNTNIVIYNNSNDDDDTTVDLFGNKEQ